MGLDITAYRRLKKIAGEMSYKEYEEYEDSFSKEGWEETIRINDLS